ncbi:MAG: hypothetical protein NZL89_03855 [Leptospiraceae bacterium]|nr:hypothetical protein [Leptospiraceae bacterium]
MRPEPADLHHFLAKGYFLWIAVVLAAPRCEVARFSEFRGEKLRTQAAALREGKRAAEKFCSGCHLLPQPESMSQDNANFVLAYMGLFLGIDASRTLDEAERTQFRQRYEFLKRTGQIPSRPQLQPEEWQFLRNWYLAVARHPFVSSEPAQPAKLTPLPFADAGVTMLLRTSDGYAVGGGLSGQLFFLDAQFRTVAAVKLDSPPVHLIEKQAGFYVLTLGSLLGALEGSGSSIWFIERKNKKAQRLLQGLARSAHFLLSDFDGDGTEDFLIAGFGSIRGGGLLLAHRRNGRFVLENLAALDSVVRLALLAQDGTHHRLLALTGGAAEKLVLLESYNGQLANTKVLAEYPPHLGSVWLEVADLNQDGEKEILVLSGDNADAGPYHETKPDQGLRIYQLSGQKLVQRHFESLPGALSLALWPRRAATAIAVARFYSDPKTPQDLTVLEPVSGWKFQRRHYSLDSRPVLVLPIDAEALLVGSGNLPVLFRSEQGPKLRQFQGPALGLLRLKN